MERNTTVWKGRKREARVRLHEITKKNRTQNTERERRSYCTGGLLFSGLVTSHLRTGIESRHNIFFFSTDSFFTLHKFNYRTFCCLVLLSFNNKLTCTAQDTTQHYYYYYFLTRRKLIIPLQVTD